MMNARIRGWIGANSAILFNATSMIGTTAVTSGLGFIYWWLAARSFPAADVGLASAAISSMTLLSAVAVFGLGSLLVLELAGHPGQRIALIATALLTVAAAGALLGLLFAVAAPALSQDLGSLDRGLGSMALFAAGVSLAAVALVLDQALVGLFLGGLQLGRNALFAIVKLLALVAVSLWLGQRTGMGIYGTWAGGNALSLAALLALAVCRGARLAAFRPQWHWLRGLRRSALSHHALNLVLQAPSLALPLLVTIQLSLTMNARFYVAWMVAGFAYIAPAALATMLYASAAAEPGNLAERARFTLRVSLALAILCNVVLWPAAGLLLSLFGRAYAVQAADCLRILGLAVFPLIAKNHYVAISRARGTTTRAAVLIAVGAFLELGLAGAGARLSGLLGLSVGWVLGLTFEAALAIPTLYQTVTADGARRRLLPPAPRSNVPAAPAPGRPAWAGSELEQPAWERGPTTQPFLRSAAPGCRDEGHQRVRGR